MTVFFRDLMVFISVCLLALMIATQIVIPLYCGTTLFPLFAKTESDAPKDNKETVSYNMLHRFYR